MSSLRPTSKTTGLHVLLIDDEPRSATISALKDCRLSHLGKAAFFRLADQLEARYHKAKAHVDKLQQSILAKAFRGELTADWRAANPHLITGENSAQALLAKIKAERDKPKKTSKQQAMFNE